jgi:hypothetical protein
MRDRFPPLNPSLIIAIGVALVILTWLVDPKYAKWVVLPDLYGPSNASIGILSIGVLYALVGSVCYLGLVNGHRKLGRALAVVVVAIPLLIGIYWVVAHLPPVLREYPFFGEHYSLRTFASEAFTYLPIALGLPFAHTDTPRERQAIVGIAVISVAIPVALALPIAIASGGFAMLLVIGGVITLVFDGILAYPIYRLANRDQQDG